MISVDHRYAGKEIVPARIEGAILAFNPILRQSLRKDSVDFIKVDRLMRVNDESHVSSFVN